MISASRSGGRRRPSRRARSSVVQSGMAETGDAVDGLDKGGPGLSLAFEHPDAGRGEPVKPAATLAGLLNPAPADPAPLLQPVEQGIERGHMETDHALGAGLDQLAELVAVAGLVFQQGEDEEIGAALLEFAVAHVG